MHCKALDFFNLAAHPQSMGMIRSCCLCLAFWLHTSEKGPLYFAVGVMAASNALFYKGPQPAQNEAIIQVCRAQGLGKREAVGQVPPAACNFNGHRVSNLASLLHDSYVESRN